LEVPAGTAEIRPGCEEGRVREDVFHLVRLALQLGRVDRGLAHPDGYPESDTDHSVNLAWLACSIAREFYPDLNLGLICQFAVVHDAVEVYAGDTYAVTAGDAGRKKQKEDEEKALYRIWDELPLLEWLPRMIDRYEQKDTREARFVYLCDKLAARVVLRLEGDAAARLRAQGSTDQDVVAYRTYLASLGWEEFPVLARFNDDMDSWLKSLGAA